jgi:hypothetical protein
MRDYKEQLAALKQALKLLAEHTPLMTPGVPMDEASELIADGMDIIRGQIRELIRRIESLP